MSVNHCPEKDHPGKVEGGGSNLIVLPAGTEFCVKGSTDNTGVLIADGETTLVDYLDNGHDVSYYIVYKEATSSTTTTTTVTTTTTDPGSPTTTTTRTEAPGTTTTSGPLPSSTPSTGLPTLGCVNSDGFPYLTNIEQGGCSAPIAEVPVTTGPVSRDELPATGVDAGALAILGVLSFAVGFILRRVAR